MNLAPTVNNASTCKLMVKQAAVAAVALGASVQASVSPTNQQRLMYSAGLVQSAVLLGPAQASRRGATIRIVLPAARPWNGKSDAASLVVLRADLPTGGQSKSLTAQDQTVPAVNAIPAPLAFAEPSKPLRPITSSRAAGLHAPMASAVDATLVKIKAPERRPLSMGTGELRAMMVGVAASREDFAGNRVAPALGVLDVPDYRVKEDLANVSAQPETANLGSDTLPDSSIQKYRRTDQGIEFAVTTVVNGTKAGSLTLSISDGANISVRLGDALALLEPMMDPDTYRRLSASIAADAFVTFNTLRASGIAVRFDAHDRLVLGKS